MFEAVSFEACATHTGAPIWKGMLVGVGTWPDTTEQVSFLRSVYILVLFSLVHNVILYIGQEPLSFLFIHVYVFFHRYGVIFV